MAWWGKIIGGTFGFMLGGPLGALLGAALGHSFDKGLRITDEMGDIGSGQQERVQAAFFTATFSVMGYIAKTDGRVSKAEIASAEAIMTRMMLNAEQRKAAIRLFNEGKQSGFDLNAVLTQFRRECHRRSNLLQIFIEIQINTAMADGSVHAAEKRAIYEIGEILGFAPHQIEHLFHIAGAAPAAHNTRAKLKEAYEVLGIDENASDAEIKKAYRRLMSQHHPDKLVAKGLPEEMMKLATEKTRQIREAYDRIKEARSQ